MEIIVGVELCFDLVNISLKKLFFFPVYAGFNNTIKLMMFFSQNTFCFLLISSVQSFRRQGSCPTKFKLNISARAETVCLAEY